MSYGHLRLREQHVHVAGQAARDRVDREAHGLAGGAQLADEVADRALRLCDGHAVARHDHHAVGLLEGRGHAVRVDRDHLALDLHRRARRAAPPAEDHVDEAAVHRAAHDVAQDRARRADQRAGHDQQVVAQREADRRRGPARIGVQHRHDDGHVRPADPHDEVVADEPGHDGHDEHRPDARAAEVEDPEQHADRERGGVERVPARQLHRLAVDATRELAEGDDRAGERHRADEDAEEHLDAQDADLDRVLEVELLPEPGERGDVGEDRLGPQRQQEMRRAQLEDVLQHDLGVEPDEHRGEADEAVERGDELRHLGHLHPAGDDVARAAADPDRQEDQELVAHPRPEDRRHHGERHADDAVPDRALGALLVRQPAQREDEQDRGDDVGRGGEAGGEHGAALSSSGTWRACAG